eukprot:436713_1
MFFNRTWKYCAWPHVIIIVVLLLTVSSIDFDILKRVFKYSSESPVQTRQTTSTTSQPGLEPFHNLITYIDRIMDEKHSNSTEDELQLIYDYVSTIQKLKVNDIQFDLPNDLDQKLKFRFSYIFDSLHNNGYSEYSSVWSSLKEGEKLITINHNYKNGVILINNALQEIRPFDIKYMLQLLNKTKSTEQMLVNQDIVLFLGYTGAGKSTAIHFMCGSKFKETDTRHLKPIITNPNCARIEITERITESDTKFITAIPVNLNECGVDSWDDDSKTDIMLCDTPGFFDTDGAEMDVANGLGIINAVKKAKSVRILVTIDWRAGIGNKMQSLKTLAYTLARILPTFKKYKKSIGFILTKVPPKERNQKQIKAIITRALQENTDKHDSTFIDFLVMLKKSESIILDPLESDRTDIMQKLFEDKEWISSPYRVVKSFVTETSMSKIIEQISKHKEIIMRMVNNYENQQNVAIDTCNDENECVINEIASKLDFQILDIKLSELYGLQQCLPDIKVIKDSLNQCIDIIRNAFNKKIAVTINKLSYSNQHHDINEFTQNVINYKLTMNDIDQMIRLQNKYFQNNIGTSPLLLNETLTNEFDISLSNCSISFNSSVYFKKSAVFKQYFAQFDTVYLNKITELQNDLKKIIAQTKQSIQQNNAEDVYNNLQLLGNAMHLNVEEFDINEMVNNLENQLIKHLNSLTKYFETNFEIKNDIWSVHNIQNANDTLRTLGAYNIQFSTANDGINSKLSTQITNMYEAALTTMSNYCNGLSEFITNKLNVQSTKQTNEQNRLKIIKSAMDEFNDIYQMNHYIQMETSPIYYQTTNAIISYLTNIEIRFNSIVTKIENDEATDYDYKLLNDFTQILNNSDWIFKMSGKEKGDIIERISEQLKHRMLILEQESKRIIPSIEDPASLQLVRNVLGKLAKIRILEQFLPQLSETSNHVINVIQNDVRRILNTIIKDFSLQPSNSNNEIIEILSEVNALIKKNEQNELVMDQPIAQLLFGLQNEIENVNQLTPDDEESITTNLPKIKQQIDAYTQFQHFTDLLYSNGLFTEMQVVDINTLKNTLKNAINNHKNKIEERTLNYKTISKCLVFVNKCREVPWMQQFQEGVHYDNMKTVIDKCSDTVISFLEEYGKLQDKKLRKNFDALLNIDEKNMEFEDNKLWEYGEMISEILFEYKNINKRHKEYSNIIKYVYEDTDISDDWKILIRSKYTDLEFELQRLSRMDPVQLDKAIQRTRILSNKMDWFLEYLDIKRTFRDLYLQYQSELDIHKNLESVSSAIQKKDFLETSRLMHPLSKFSDAHSQNLYSHAQTMLRRKIFEIYENSKAHIMQLRRSFNTESDNDNIRAIRKYFTLIKDSQICTKYLTDKDKKEMNEILSQSTSLLYKYIKSISSMAVKSTGSYKFATAEQYIARCTDLLSRLSDLFGDKIQEMTDTCQKAQSALDKKLNDIENKYKNEIQFDSETVERRINLYSRNGIQRRHRALMDATKINAKYDYDRLWNDIEDDIKIKFRDLLSRSKNAKTYQESVNILSLCEDILNSLPKITQNALKTEYKAVNDLIKNSNRQQIQQLHEYLKDNDISQIYVLYNEMKSIRNREMMRIIQKELSDKARQIQAHLDQAIVNKNSVDIKYDLRMLDDLDSSFPSDTQYKQIEIEYFTARTKIETFISDKIESIKTLIKSIKRQCINQIQDNLDLLLRLFKSDNPKDTKIFQNKVREYSQQLSKFITQYFDKQIKTFTDALNDLDSGKMNKLLNTMKLFDSTESDIRTKLESFENVQINEHANYNTMVTNTKTQLNNVKKQILNTGLINDKIQRKMSNEHYNYFLHLKYQLLSLKKCDKLKSHIEEKYLVGYYQECMTKLQTEMQEIIKNLKNKLINSDRLNEKTCDYINDYYRILVALDQANVFSIEDEDKGVAGWASWVINGGKSQLKSEIVKINKLIDKKLSSLEGKVMQSLKVEKSEGTFKINYDQLVDTLVQMEMMNSILLDFRDNTKSRIDKCLREFKKQHPSEVNSLYSILNHKQDVWANHIVQSYSIFNAIAISQFNKLTAAFGIDHVLKHIKGIGDDIETTSKKNELKQLFSDFKTKYEALVKQYLLPPDKINLNPLVSKIKKIPQDLKQTKKEITWDSQTKDKVVSLMSHLFALWTLQNSASYFEVSDKFDAKSYLLQPRDAQIISIFRILGIGNTASSYSEKIWNEFKNTKVGSWFGLTTEIETLMPNLVEIGTGEGKSLTLAVSSAILALLGFNVNCVCYSKYLSQRDYKAFEPLFISLGIQDHIVYGTFNELCENIINENGNIRDMVHDLILPLNNGDDNNDDDSVKGDNNRANVLLIDEVDVFFNKQFYGQFYTPGAVLKHECIKNITDYIWNHYEDNGYKSMLELRVMKETDEYKECMKIFTEEWRDIIDEQVKCMLADINTFDSPKYVVRNDKIGYKEGDQISYTATVGYKTLFAYYYEHYVHHNVISEQSLNNMIAIYLKCGTLSYAEIPKRFNIIMGVTGTLRHLSKPELKTMDENYGLKIHTFMPSLFGENKNKFNKQQDITISTIERFDEKLKNEIFKRLKDHSSPRCVFVFFEDTRKLMSFYETFQHFHDSDKIRILTEQLTFEEKESAVLRAPQSNTVALLTKSFGRGTDFKVMDDLVLNNGGPHVIQTFVSLEKSEETQIKGRTARQGGDGSYSLLLIDEELEKFDITKEEIKTAIDDAKLYDLIDNKRRIEFAKEYTQTSNRIQTALEIHQNGEAFLNALHTNNVSKIKQDLVSYNLGPSAPNTMKVAICVDATGSMGSLLDKTKEKIRLMFKRIREILKDNDMDPNSFEIQFIAYRNYNAPAEELLLSSGWQNDPNQLDTFLSDVDHKYGWTNEAVEVCLEFVNNDQYVNEVMFIGDYGANTKDETIYKRKSRGEDYWRKTKFEVPVFFEEELKKIKDRKLKINALYLKSFAKNDFIKMASETGGKSDMLDIDSTEGAEQLTGLISKAVLNACAGHGEKGQKLVQDYDAKFTHIS